MTITAQDESYNAILPLATKDYIQRFVEMPFYFASYLLGGYMSFDHGTVTADWSADNATAAKYSTLLEFYITDLSLVVQTDPTAEAAIQEIPILVVITDTTDSENRWAGMMSIPSNCHVSFKTPVVIPANHNFRTTVYLGGATNLAIVTCINGFGSGSIAYG